LLEGDRPMHVTKAAVAAAGVVTVAMVARQAPPVVHSPHPSSQVIVAERPATPSHQRVPLFAAATVVRPAGPAAHAQRIAERMIRTVASAADLALGTEVAAADQEPPPTAGKEPSPPPTPDKAAPSDPLHVDENDIVLRQDGHTLHFTMKD